MALYFYAISFPGLLATWGQVAQKGATVYDYKGIL